MGLVARCGLSVLVTVVAIAACGPTGIDAAADTESGHEDSSDASSPGEAGEAGSTGEFEPARCPCEEEGAAWMWCDDQSTAAADTIREVTTVASVPEGNTRRFAVYADTIYMAHHEGNTVSEAELQAWAPGDDGFALVDALGDDHRVYALAADEVGLLVLHKDRREWLALLSRWTPDAGLQTVAALDDEEFEPRERGVLSVGGGHALVGAEPREWDIQWPEDADAVLDVDLDDGSIEVGAAPLSGVVAVDDGWWARRPTLDTYQYCFDYACFRPQVATSWQVVSASGETMLDPEICVESFLGVAVAHAWVDNGAYIFTTRQSARRIDASGDRTLWRDGGIDDAWLDGDSLWLTTSQEVEDGAPGEGRNALIRVDLASFDAQRWLDDPVDDVRDDIDIVGRIGDLLVLARPRRDGRSDLVTLNVSP